MSEKAYKNRQYPQRILLFGGTIEGRRVSEYLSGRGVPHTVCVATEYGEEVLQSRPGVQVHQGRMDEEQMCLFLKEGGYTLVVDATHPYAVAVSGNIRRACMRTEIPCLRYLRPRTDGGEESPVPEQKKGLPEIIRVSSAQEAAAYLERQSGAVFLTTGSKELSVFCQTLSDPGRLFARVLPSAEVLSSCRALGLEGRQLCAMQGPFSAEINEAMLRQTKAAFLVTKDTGASGGFPEKLRAAAACGVCAVVIDRPQERGEDWETIRRKLDQALTGRADASGEPAGETGAGQQADADSREPVQESAGRNAGAMAEKNSHKPVQESAGRNAGAAPEAISREPGQESAGSKTGAKPEECGFAPRICCIGIGMGTPETLTQEAGEEILRAQVLFGAKRILKSAQLFLEKKGAACPSPELVAEYEASKIAAYLREHPQIRRAAILMSGDVGFYSGARAVAEVFPPETVRFYCGISSVVYFASRIPTSWQDAKLLSAHGKELALANYVGKHPKIILLVSGAEDVRKLCAQLCACGFGHVRVTVGTNLSYPEETVTAGRPEDFLDCSTKGLHIVMVENPSARPVAVPGIPDEQFVRGRVPMTKEEIRILSVAKLGLSEDSVVYDVGAGTGSVSVECARLCTAGWVYAIEKNPEGIRLIQENSRKLGAANLTAVEGTAPDAFAKLPAPTHAFIGGSSGNMREILTALREKNPKLRIVINVIALESLAEVTALLREQEADIVQISAAKSRALGSYHLMTAHNPVYIITLGGRKE